MFMSGYAEKKAVIITGASRRIGRAMAIFLASKLKYDILAVYNTAREAALSLQEIVESNGQKCVLFQADLRNHSLYEQIVSYAFTEMPYCNTLINNASLFYKDNLKDCTVENFSENFDIHVRAPIFLTQHFAAMCSGQGKVVNIVEADVERIKTKYFSYLLSKKSLFCFTKMAAEELYPSICVNAICPTIIPNCEIDCVNPTSDLCGKPTLSNFLTILESLLDFDNPRSGESLTA